MPQIGFANQYSVPFLAVSGGHGQASTLNNVHHGIGILMRGLDWVDIDASGEQPTALVGGGIITGDLQQKLWDEGFQTGMCIPRRCSSCSAEIGHSCPGL